jgi:hypothetical protein
MSHRTVVISTFDDYLAEEVESLEERAAEKAERAGLLIRFPHAVMLKVSYPELDFADRWCWQRFGPRDGECMQRYSEYPACERTEVHSHSGKWTSHWWVKTDYDFGFNEWYFADSSDRESFAANVKNISFGENYHK